MDFIPIIDINTGYNPIFYNNSSRRIAQSLVYGPTGSTGATGTDGATGAQGIQGPEGSVGQPGAQGIQGLDGSVGQSGAQGVQGSEGSVGPRGIPGTQGEPGIQGSQGPVGSVGAQGPQGIPGLEGPPGTQGPQGVPAPRTTITKILNHVTAFALTTAAAGSVVAVPGWSATYTASGRNVRITAYITGMYNGILAPEFRFIYYILRNGVIIGTPGNYNFGWKSYVSNKHESLAPINAIIYNESGTNTYSISINGFMVDTFDTCLMTVIEC
jgi:Collagen triple helix repeat (20 copies)